MSIEEQLVICKAATPGPWKILPPHVEGSNSLRIFAGTDLIAYVGNSDETTVQLKSNAKLISDARTNYPAALRALQDAFALIDRAFMDGSQLTGDEARTDLRRIRKRFERGEYGK